MVSINIYTNEKGYVSTVNSEVYLKSIKEIKMDFLG